MSVLAVPGVVWGLVVPRRSRPVVVALVLVRPRLRCLCPRRAVRLRVSSHVLLLPCRRRRARPTLHATAIHQFFIRPWMVLRLRLVSLCQLTLAGVHGLRNGAARTGFARTRISHCLSGAADNRSRPKSAELLVQPLASAARVPAVRIAASRHLCRITPLARQIVLQWSARCVDGIAQHRALRWRDHS